MSSFVAIRRSAICLAALTAICGAISYVTVAPSATESAARKVTQPAEASAFPGSAAPPLALPKETVPPLRKRVAALRDPGGRPAAPRRLAEKMTAPEVHPNRDRLAPASGGAAASSASPRVAAGSASEPLSAAERETRESLAEDGNTRLGGNIAPSDLASLRARAVTAEIIESEETPADAKAAAVLAAQPSPSSKAERELADRAAIGQITAALRRNPNPEDLSDLLALASDTAERSGARIRPLIMEGLRPGQPLEVQRQALYLATHYNVGIVQALAARPDHPLQQDAEAFLLELELEQNRPPESAVPAQPKPATTPLSLEAPPVAN